MPMIAAISFLGFVRIVLAVVSCEKELNYHDVYGYGTDIFCEGITKDNEKFLKDMSVYKEVRLDIKSSDLSNVTKNIFSNVQNIRLLSIMNSSVNFSDNETILDSLHQIEHIIVQNTVLTRVNANIFQRLTKLKSVSLVNNSLSTISPTALKHLDNLETLQLSNNKITHLGSIPLCEVSNLKTLRVDRNLIRSLKNYTFGCYKSRMKLKIVNPSLSKQELSSNLVHIDLSYNNIRKLGSFAGAPKLKYLNLEYNNIKEIDSKLFKPLKNLKQISLQQNKLQTFGNEGVTNLTSLESINLESNRLVKVEIQNLQNLKYLNLSKNKLVCNSVTSLAKLTMIQHLLLNNNNLNGFCSDVFKNLTFLKQLILSSNKLKFTDSSFNNLVQLKELSLQDNGLDFLSNNLFKHLTNLEHLDLSKNKLKFVKQAVFNNLTNLLVLNMSYNQLEYLDYNTLKPLENLQVLDIAGNKLHNFHYNLTISLLPSLRTINIKSNLLTCHNLYKIIVFLKARNINFTVHENFEYDKENVAGIYCQDSLNKLQTSSNIASLAWFLLISLSIVMCTVGYKVVIYYKRRSYVKTADEMELVHQLNTFFDL